MLALENAYRRPLHSNALPGVHLAPKGGQAVYGRPRG